MSDVKLYDVEQAARLLSVSPHTLRQWAREGRLAVTRLGRAMRFAPAALDRFVESNTREPARDDDAGRREGPEPDAA